MTYAPLALCTYLLLLPFQRLGIPFLGHRIAPADGVLLFACLLAVPAWIQPDRRALLPGPLRRLPWLLAGFLAAGALSSLASPSPASGFRALLPYVYALVLIAAFGPALGRPTSAVETAIGLAGATSIALTSLIALIPGVLPADWRALAFDSGNYALFSKYRFLLEGPTQLAMLTLSGFGILTIARIRGARAPILLDICLPALFANLVLASGSRAVAPSGLALLAAFHGAQWLQVRASSGAARRRGAGAMALSLAAALLLVSYQLVVRPNPTAQRTVSGLLDVAVRVIPPLGRFINPEPFFVEKMYDAVELRSHMNDAGREAFRAHPFLGAGPGQVRDDRGREVHNTVLAVAAEMGVVGLLALTPLAWLPIGFLLRSRRPFEERVQLGLVLAALLLPHLFHFLLRERWTWLFVIVLLCADTPRVSEPSADEAPAGL